MAKRVQFIGNTTAGTAAFVGLAREITVDTDRNELIVNTGAGAGTQKRIPNKDTNDAAYQAINTLITAIAALTVADGLVAKSGAATVAARTITGDANGLQVANGGGAAGNPTITFMSTIQIGMQTVTGLLTLSGSVTGGATEVSGLKHKSPTATVQALGTLSASQTVTITTGCVITATFGALGANATIIFAGYPATGIYAGWELHLTMDATPHTITFQRSSGNAVTYDSTTGQASAVASKVMKWFFETTDAGTTVTAHYLGSF